MGELFAGRYELVDLLDSGGAGSVWRVWDRRSQRYLAAKVLRQSDSDSLVRFVQETSRRIDHPHVVAPHGWSGEDDRVLFTMPLIEGGSLAQLLADHGALPVGWAGELLGQVLTALAAVHDAGLVHRDIKPGNLLLDATGTDPPHVRLSDFGSSVQVDGPRLTRVGTVVGTPGYVAPEQGQGVADPHPAQDVYALGVVTMQVLTGIAPSVDSRLPPRPAGDSHALVGLWDLCLRMTSVVPHERPTVQEAMSVLDAVPGARNLGAGNDPENPVEVFTQVPPLPQGWGPRGPEDAGTAAERAEQAGQTHRREPERQPGQRPEQQPGQRPEQQPTERPTEVLSVSPPATRQVRPETEPPPRGGVPPLSWALVAVGLVLLVLAFLVSR